MYTELNAVYFWTITIKEWFHLLKTDESKTIITESLKWLCEKELVRIYGYVIMPNHIHLIRLKDLCWIHVTEDIISGKKTLWQFCKLSEEYRFSSASFYENGKDEFGILTHYMDVF